MKNAKSKILNPKQYQITKFCKTGDLNLGFGFYLVFGAWNLSKGV